MLQRDAPALPLMEPIEPERLAKRDEFVKTSKESLIILRERGRIRRGRNTIQDMLGISIVAKGCPRTPPHGPIDPERLAKRDEFVKTSKDIFNYKTGRNEEQEEKENEKGMKEMKGKGEFSKTCKGMHSPSWNQLRKGDLQKISFITLE